MYNQPETVLEQYDLKINQITKARGAYLCATDAGMKLLVPFSASMERATFLMEVLKRLEAEGHPAEQITCTREGLPLVEDETGVRYWLKTYVPGGECPTGRQADMAKAMQCLARFHVTVEKCAFSAPEFMKNARSDLGSVYERHYRELIKLKNYVRSRKRKNAYESKFWEQYPHYIADAQRALALFRGQESQPENAICHGDVNQHNLVRTPEGYRLVNFENVCVAPVVMDVANFLRKLLEKNNYNCELGLGLLEEYQKVRPLSQEERNRLYLTLLFPEKFWKIANHYANSHKVLSGRDVEKLERIICQENSRSIFLEKLFAII